MKLSLLTLGCPKWDLATICERGPRYGFAGVDFRGYLDAIDITTLPLFSTQAASTRRQINDAGLEVSGISSSLQVCDPDVRQRNLDEARRTIATARGLGAGLVRVFGGGNPKKYSRDELVKTAAGLMAEVLALDGARELRWLFESHDQWVPGAETRRVLEAVASPNFGALWDMGNTCMAAGESPEQTWAAIGPHVGCVHVKDAAKTVVDGKPTWRYTMPGQGQLPLARAIGVLKAGGYDGWLVCEHEKRWIPDLPEPEEYFPAFVQWAKRQL